ncbi:MAG TPA: hypothetical protein VGF04_04410, partial [Solirubrobacterales bacterium]
ERVRITPALAPLSHCSIASATVVREGALCAPLLSADCVSALQARASASDRNVFLIVRRSRDE